MFPLRQALDSPQSRMPAKLLAGVFTALAAATFAGVTVAAGSAERGLGGELCVGAGGPPMSAAETRAFAQDVAFVAETIEKTHPAPYARADRAKFLRDASHIRSYTARRSVGCATVELMALVAELNDGHTYVAPINVPRQTRWFPWGTPAGYLRRRHSR